MGVNRVQSALLIFATEIIQLIAIYGVFSGDD